MRILAEHLKQFKEVALHQVSLASISETHAAELFFSIITHHVFEEWPKVISQLREVNKENLSEDILDHIDEEGAKIELLLAAMALDLRAMRNLFPKVQAQRLYVLSIESFPQQEVRDYAECTFEEYISRFDEDVKSGLNPLPAVGDIIYGRWGLAGTAYVPGEFFIAPKPVVALLLAQCAISFVGVWKQIQTNYIMAGETMDQAIDKKNIFTCPNCDAGFDPKDYRIDAQEWLCSSCLKPLSKISCEKLNDR
jgi:hypothetical protein